MLVLSVVGSADGPSRWIHRCARCSRVRRRGLRSDSTLRFTAFKLRTRTCIRHNARSSVLIPEDTKLQWHEAIEHVRRVLASSSNHCVILLAEGWTSRSLSIRNSHHWNCLSSHPAVTLVLMRTPSKSSTNTTLRSLPAARLIARVMQVTASFCIGLFTTSTHNATMF